MFLNTSLCLVKADCNIDLKLYIFLAFIISLCFHADSSPVLAGKTKMLAPATDECHCFTEHLYFILFLKNILATAASVFMVSG